MDNKNFETYFDCGCSKIRATAFNKNNNQNYFCNESKFFLNYLEIDITYEFQKIIASLENNTKEYLNDINLMIDSPKMLSIEISLFQKLDGLKLKKEHIQFLIQDAKQQILRNYASQNILHIIIKNYKIDGLNFEYLPNNLECNLISLDILFICLPKNIVEFYKNKFSELGISVNRVICTSYAKSINYKNNLSLIDKILFIDIGFNKTSIICYDNNRINFFHTFPIGSNNITKDLSKVLDIDLVSAEKLKLYFVEDKNLSKEKNISLDLIQQIIFARIEEILELCDKSKKLNSNFDQADSFRMMLMGDGSKILNNEHQNILSVPHRMDLLEEGVEAICQSGRKLTEGLNKQEVIIIPRKQTNLGFFEKFFHLFR